MGLFFRGLCLSRASQSVWGKPLSARSCRCASLNSAISNGIRKDRSVAGRNPKPWDKQISNAESRPHSRELEYSGRQGPRSQQGRERGLRRDSHNRDFDIGRQGTGSQPGRGYGRRDFHNRELGYSGQRETNFRQGQDRRPRDDFHRPELDYGREARPRQGQGGSDLHNRVSEISGERETRTKSWWKYSSNGRAPIKRKKGKKIKPTIDSPVSLVSKVSLVCPRSVPHTNAVSEFIYGYSAVRAAVLASRRKIYALYIYDADPSSTKWAQPEVNALQKHATVAGATVKLVSGTWLKMMNRMSDDRPHNGYVAEVSPLPKLPATSLKAVTTLPATHFTVNVASQPKEEADINGSDGHIPLMSQRNTDHISQQTPRYPFILLLDGILDPGNLGAIIRSAYFFGADAIAFSSRNSAPLSAVTIKASAGAAENMPLISIHDPATFIDTSRGNGWRFFAAEPPASTFDDSQAQVDTMLTKTPILSPHNLSAEPRKSPCVLMLGSEGYGLSKYLKRKADAFVAIPGAQAAGLSDDPAGVDSLNVSVASALLCQEFLREPSPGQNYPSPIRPKSPTASESVKETEEDRVF
ncbi:predicted protein [Uncinocarpus reesii 1704]|uniref:rRNA methyltransferase 1, mitochondrial n=1 Tax=Uncinocarpus reesii (strain UAMH 1704) TaxID=336963 RepID=C4JDU4_UNCRE|nr:uncharacterized protein UREG_00571 [Uncinocarpus reesii 1704]EEP75724.1 predicted protein [Uncinocarpus reesii 1704]